jgi:hypothetical protein
MSASFALIHEFKSTDTIITDDDGDQMLGFYYQFAVGEEQALTGLVGPYNRRTDVEKAAQVAFDSGDF